MKHKLLLTFALLIVFSASAYPTAKSDTEAAQNFAVALKRGEEITELIEMYKKISTQSPLRLWANRLAVEEFGTQWLALVKPPSK